MNVTHHAWATKLIFHSKPLGHKRYFLYLFILLNNIRFVSYIRRLLLKRIVLKQCVKNNLKKTLWNSTYKHKRIISTFIKTLLVYFKIHLVYQSQQPQQQLPLSVPYHCQRIKLAIGAMAEQLHKNKENLDEKKFNATDLVLFQQEYGQY